MVFAGIDDTRLAYEAGAITIKAPIKVRVNGTLIDTCYGRLLFNQILPEGLDFINETVGKGVLKKALAKSFDLLGSEVTAQFVDNIKNFGYKNATISGLSISKEDMVLPDVKKELLEQAQEKVKFIQKKHWNGFVTEEEKYNQSIAIWAQVKNTIEKEMKSLFLPSNHVFNFIDSGAR